MSSVKTVYFLRVIQMSQHPMWLALWIYGLGVKLWCIQLEGLKVCICVSCLTVCNPTNCTPPGSSIRGILQARILEWIASPFSRGSSQLRDRNWVSRTAGRFFTVWVTREAPKQQQQLIKHYCTSWVQRWTHITLKQPYEEAPLFRFSGKRWGMRTPITVWSGWPTYSADTLGSPTPDLHSWPSKAKLRVCQCPGWQEGKLTWIRVCNNHVLSAMANRLKIILGSESRKWQS